MVDTLRGLGTIILAILLGTVGIVISIFILIIALLYELVKLIILSWKHT